MVQIQVWSKYLVCDIHCSFFSWVYSYDGEGNGTPLQYSCLENPMGGGAWWTAAHGVTKSRTRLSYFTFTFHFHKLEKEMVSHSSILAWRIPGTGEPGGLPTMGSHRVGHDWRNLTVAAAAVMITKQSYKSSLGNDTIFLDTSASVWNNHSFPFLHCWKPILESYIREKINFYWGLFIRADQSNLTEYLIQTWIRF